LIVIPDNCPLLAKRVKRDAAACKYCKHVRALDMCRVEDVIEKVINVKDDPK